VAELGTVTGPDEASARQHAIEFYFDPGKPTIPGRYANSGGANPVAIGPPNGGGQGGRTTKMDPLKFEEHLIKARSATTLEEARAEYEQAITLLFDSHEKAYQIADKALQVSRDIHQQNQLVLRTAEEAVQTSKDAPQMSGDEQKVH
jgi:hypothetical protein